MTKSRKPVLVTGGDYRIALSVTRALGRHGVPVAVLANDPWAITFQSRYCSQRIVSPPDYQRDDYQAFVLDLVTRQEFAGILFGDDLGAFNVGHMRDALSPHVSFMLPRQDWLDLSLNKRQMLQYAKSAGICMPATAFPADVDDIEDSISGFCPPLIVKGIRGDSSRHLRVCHSLSGDELKSAFIDIAAMEQAQGISDKPLVQEYVTGGVYSAIVLADQGDMLACFIMKKIHTFPAWGGICVEGQSVHDEAVVDAVRSVLEKVPWHGIAEIEFIKDSKDGTFKFVELSPDFNWGLDFAVHAGVDFPMMAYQMMQGSFTACPPLPQYRSGQRFLWFLPEGVRYMRKFPAAIPGMLFKALQPGVGTDLCLRDLRAMAHQIKRIGA